MRKYAFLSMVVLMAMSNAASATGICSIISGTIVCQNTAAYGGYVNWIVGRDSNDLPGVETIMACYEDGSGVWHEFGRQSRSSLTSIKIEGSSNSDTITIAKDELKEYDCDMDSGTMITGFPASWFSSISLNGNGGIDALIGSDLDETIDGGDGDNQMWGNGGNDTIKGGNYEDYLNGGDGDDALSGGGGINVLEGGAGSDTLVGGADTDFIYGHSPYSDGTEADVIDGNGGYDVIWGGGGDDTITAGGIIYGGPGNDEITAAYVSGVYIWGNDGDDNISGGSGDDYIWGGNDDDEICGDSGNDSIWGENGNDILNGKGGMDKIWGGAGNDQIIDYGDFSPDMLFGEDGDDLLVEDSSGICDGGDSSSDECDCATSIILIGCEI